MIKWFPARGNVNRFRRHDGTGGPPVEIHSDGPAEPPLTMTEAFSEEQESVWKE